MNESFTSRVFCVPDKVVESVSGAAEPGIEKEELEAYKEVKDAGKGEEVKESEVFRSLKNRWSLKELKGGEGTQVDLDIEFEFWNPMYAAMSGAVAEKVAPRMVEAFEKRAREMLGKGTR